MTSRSGSGREEEAGGGNRTGANGFQGQIIIIAASTVVMLVSGNVSTGGWTF